MYNVLVNGIEQFDSMNVRPELYASYSAQASKEGRYNSTIEGAGILRSAGLNWINVLLY